MMDDKEFDQLMRRLAVREKPPEAGARLVQALASLPDAPAPRRRAIRRLVPALAAALLVCVTAVAAQLGLLSFWETNPYRLFHNRERVQPELHLRPLSVTDASALRLTEVSALDAAWIEGRLTLSLRIAARNGQPLAVGRLEEDCVRLSGGQAENGSAHPSAPVLLEDGFACYTRPDDADGWPDGGMSVACLPDGGCVTLALQLPPDFLTASDLSALADGDAIPLRLEWTVYDPLQGRAIMESALLAAPVPTGAEKEEMNP